MEAFSPCMPTINSSHVLSMFIFVLFFLSGFCFLFSVSIYGFFQQIQYISNTQ